MQMSHKLKSERMQGKKKIPNWVLNRTLATLNSGLIKFKAGTIIYYETMISVHVDCEGKRVLDGEHFMLATDSEI